MTFDHCGVFSFSGIR